MGNKNSAAFAFYFGLLVSLLGLLLEACGSGGNPDAHIVATVDVASYFPKDFQLVGDPQGVEVDPRGTMVYVAFYKAPASQGQLWGGFFSGEGDRQSRPMNMIWQEFSRQAYFGRHQARAEARNILNDKQGRKQLVISGMTETLAYPTTVSIFRPSVVNNRLSLELIHPSFVGNRGVEIKDVNGDGRDDIVERDLFQGNYISSTAICRKRVFLQTPEGSYPLVETWRYIDFCDERPPNLIEPEEVVVAYYRAKGVGAGEEWQGFLADKGLEKDSRHRLIWELSARPGDNPANKRLITVSLLDAKTYQPVTIVTWLLAYVPQPEKQQGIWRMEARR